MISEIVRALVDAGATPQMILAAVEAAEAKAFAKEAEARARAEEKRAVQREQAAERQRRHRLSRVTNAMSRDVTRDSEPIIEHARARVEDNLLPIETSGIKKKENTSDSEFSEWYAAYPRHEAKGQALKAYRAARKKASADELLRGAHAAHHRFQAPYIPLPASWLNGERWADAVNGHHATGPPVPEGFKFRDASEIIAEARAEIERDKNLRNHQPGTA